MGRGLGGGGGDWLRFLLFLFALFIGILGNFFQQRRVYMMPGSFDLWIMDSKTGVLRINKRHPSFVACLDKDAWLARLNELIVLHALRIQVVPQEWREQLKMLMDGHMSDMVFIIKQGSSHGAKPSKK